MCHALSVAGDASVLSHLGHAPATFVSSALFMSTSKITRREAMGALGAAAAGLTIGCGNSPTGPTDVSSVATTPGTTSSAACAVAPEETIGPYPSLRDLFRSDIREGRPGTPVTLALTVVNASSDCSPVPGALVDIWQCDADGHYSQYSQPGYNGTAETFLRGTQTTDAGGRVTFTTIYPGWYQGRATHIHVEVTLNGRSLKVTQIAFPESINQAVYSSGVYATRGQNPTSNARDMVFADSVSSELATVTGDPAGGITATFTVGVSA
jgi:protocatechuate 3,4-dioxygenase beta subunit